ncbi:MAG: ATP-binding protein [Pseudomonadota bacterium]
MKRLSALLRLSAVRQTLGLLAVFTLITVIAWGGAYWLFQRDMLRAVDARLTARMEAAIAALDAGQPLAAAEAGDTAEFFTGSRADGFESVDLADGYPEMRYLLRTTAHGRIRLGEDTENEEELREILAGGMVLSLLATLLAATSIGAYLAWRGQARLNVISAGLKDVARGRLDTRIALDGQDDLTQLAERINITTARLDDAMTRIRVQSSNIAHDLRTPLARLRARIESALSEAVREDRAIHPAELETALDQIDRITGTFDALLRLAQIDSGTGRDTFAAVDLSALAGRVIETFGSVVEDAGHILSVRVDDAETISGDPDLLVQLVANLLQNALRYGPRGQTITLRIRGAALRLSDEGPGIAPSERERVLQPLYQGEATRQNEGFGLGLSLVRAIADLHSAPLSLSDGPNARGLAVTLQFPKLTEL